MSVKKKGLCFFVVIFILFAAILSQIPVYQIMTFPENVVLFTDDIQAINENNIFGKFIRLSVKEDSLYVVNTEAESYEPTIQFKLFNLIPIKQQKVRILDEDKIYAGGMAVGLVLNSDGVLIIGSSPIDTENGQYNSEIDTELRVGDVITEIAGEKVDNTASVGKILNKSENKDKELNVKYLRNAKEFETTISPVFDNKTGQYKLGVWVRDDASGIGTLTYIDSKNRFGALGHPICDNDTHTMINLKDGKLYNCSVMGINKGTGGCPGEIRGLFLQGKNEQGYIEKNNEFGVFGEVSEQSTLIERSEEMQIGGRLTVKPGKAQIRCCIDGVNIKLYDIEIIKTNYQNFSNDKSMVIKIVDEDLLSKTGGIVQGMSGSPIIQNGKLVGAVTHVFVNDPTKGFGVYLDWMYRE